jgi:hypothetical protein
MQKQPITFKVRAEVHGQDPQDRGVTKAVESFSGLVQAMSAQTAHAAAQGEAIRRLRKVHPGLTPAFFPGWCQVLPVHAH